jgi:hypothetical protein
MKHGTNTRGMERVVTGHLPASKVGEFGKGEPPAKVLPPRTPGWWTDPALQQDRAKFYDMAKTQQPHMDGSALPIHQSRNSDYAT